MRITNGMIAANTIKNLNSAQVRLAAVNEQIASNEKIQLASDDSLVATRAVTYRNYVSQVAQYQDNVDAAQGWQGTTDDALSSISNVITNLKTLATQAANSTSEKPAIKTEVETDLNELLSDLNSDYVGSYVFGGYNTTSKPYEIVSTSIGDTVTYNGEYLSLGGVIPSSVSLASIDSYFANTTNTDNIYDSLTDAASRANTTYQTALAAANASPTDASLTAKAVSAKKILDTVTAAVSTYGGTTNLSDAATAAETTANELETAATTYTGLTLASAGASAYTAYQTAEAAATASPSDTTLATAAKTAKTTYDALTAAVSTYGGSTTVNDAATMAQDMADTMIAAQSNSTQDIIYNVGFSSQVTVNVNGQEVTGQGTNNIFNTIQKLLLALDGDTSYQTATMNSAGTVTVTTNSLDISDLIDEFSEDLNRVTKVQSNLGARENYVTVASDRLDEASTTYKGLMTDNENINTAEAATELTSAEYTYESTLSISAKAISKSLIDYMS